MTRTHTTGPWESRPIGSKGDIGIYVLNAPLIAAAPDLLAVAREILNNQDALPAYLVTMAVHAVGKATT